MIKSAGIIIIGNEILSGRTEDQNILFIIRKLEEKDIQCKEVAIIEDREEKIIKTVNDFRKTYDYVFTTGGIGPTHDDITSPSIAKAFDVSWVVDEKIDHQMEKFYQERSIEYNAARRRMATFPEGVSFIKNPISIAPGFCKENVYVLAGVPKIMQAMLNDVLENLEGGEKKISLNVNCSVPEGTLAEGLAKIEHMFEDVEIGSYPVFDGKNGYGTYLVVRSYHRANCHLAFDKVIALIEHFGGTPKFER